MGQTAEQTDVMEDESVMGQEAEPVAEADLAQPAAPKTPSAAEAKRKDRIAALEKRIADQRVAVSEAVVAMREAKETLKDRNEALDGQGALLCDLLRELDAEINPPTMDAPLFDGTLSQPAQPAEPWRTEPIDSLMGATDSAVTANMLEKLKDAGIKTLGDFSDYCAAHEEWDIKGIGDDKQDRIADAYAQLFIDKGWTKTEDQLDAEAFKDDIIFTLAGLGIDGTFDDFRKTFIYDDLPAATSKKKQPFEVKFVVTMNPADWLYDRFVAIHSPDAGIDCLLLPLMPESQWKAEVEAEETDADNPYFGTLVEYAGAFYYVGRMEDAIKVKA